VLHGTAVTVVATNPPGARLVPRPPSSPQKASGENAGTGTNTTCFLHAAKYAELEDPASRSHKKRLKTEAAPYCSPLHAALNRLGYHVADREHTCHATFPGGHARLSTVYP
jgi:hypothetical protein